MTLPVPPNRDELIAICEEALRPESVWHDRYSESAQRQVGELWALLRAGCEFEVDMEFAPTMGDRTIWVRTKSKGFGWFEDGAIRDAHFYLPTRKRLAEAGDKDWY